VRIVPFLVNHIQYSMCTVWSFVKPFIIHSLTVHFSLCTSRLHWNVWYVKIRTEV